MRERLVNSKTRMCIRRVGVGMSGDVLEAADTFSHSIEHTVMASLSVLDVVLDQSVGNGDDGTVAWENQVWLECFEPLKLVDVLVHVARVRGDENGADAGHHIASNQAGIAEQTHMTGVVSWRDEHRPGLLAESQLFAIGKNPLTGHGASSVFAAPDRDIKGFLQERHVGEMVAVAVRE